MITFYLRENVKMLTPLRHHIIVQITSCRYYDATYQARTSGEIYQVYQQAAS